jgi:hypothetical protein
MKFAASYSQQMRIIDGHEKNVMEIVTLEIFSDYV